ncbi:hypothetical protein [Clostridium rectalis]|uniref:hypothetical protein n=1 Tax=Clostridium rectalis TaxID=2040295 RepID=UPI001FA9E06F|nr:hypothetical protein [Clostridium rectalis]
MMKNLILNQVYSTKKNFIKSILFIFSLNVFQLISILNQGKLDKLDIKPLDFFIKIYGGVQSDFFIFQYIHWIVIICTLLFIVENIINSYKGLDFMIINRSGFRLKWWCSKIISLFLLNIIYLIVIIIIHKALTLLFLYPADYKIWSAYSKIYYNDLYNSTMNPYKLFFICLCIMLTGFIAITSFFQTINVITNNNIKIFIVLIIIIIINGILYMNNLIPRVMSPLNYPSILDIKPNIYNYLKYIDANIVLILFNTIVGSIFIIKKDIL